MDGKRLVDQLPQLIRALPHEYVARQRWFGSKASGVAGVGLRDYALLPGSHPPAILALIDVSLAGGGGVETYFLPLVASRQAGALPAAGEAMEETASLLRTPDGEVLLFDALSDEPFCLRMLRCMGSRAVLAGRHGRFVFDSLVDDDASRAGGASLRARRLRGEQSNTSVVFDDALIMKSFRRLQDGVNPDLEIVRFLTTGAGFHSIAPLAGYVEYVGNDGFHCSIAMLQAFVQNAGDGWTYSLEHLRTLYNHAHEQEVSQGLSCPIPHERLVDEVRGVSASYLLDVRRLGQVTGQMHQALASSRTDPAFVPEPVTAEDARRWSAAMSDHADAVLQQVRTVCSSYPRAEQVELLRVLQNAQQYQRTFSGLRDLERMRVDKIRHHGDYHLGQVLRTDRGFVVLDFEGEPARPLQERRAKHLTLRDVAGILRSFDYAMFGGLFAFQESTGSDATTLERWGAAWRELARDAFLHGYLGETLARSATFLPRSRPDVDRVLAILELEKAIYELGYEANNRPDWVRIPLRHLSTLGEKGKKVKGKRATEL